MKRRILTALFAVAAALTLSACDNVPAGYVGVKVDRFGGDKGVNIEVRSPGRYIAAFNTDQFLFPTFTQNKVWDHQGRANEEFVFQDKDGSALSADIGITYLVTPDNASKVFQRYRRGVEEITDTYIRAIIRDELVRNSSSKSADILYGVGKDEFVNAVNKGVKSRAAEAGITVESVYMIGAIRLPETIQNSINNKIAATQIAMQKENELQATRADAEKLRAQAQGEADAMNIRGEALRTNPEVLKQLYLERWDGKLPQTLVGNEAISVMLPSK